ncbi:MAG: 4-(cytidine 5'-diphospho)-2-C-methyl-D-erythritol kinase [Kiritimatiellae bacterium]|nr:4-(cytidine 5'-diphospho)-2-C-methyl-D-erythritol kinase [Kiritimatiellia bacterium]
MKILAYAKVNLTLDILGVREDGYHELSSIVLPIELNDTIEIIKRNDSLVTSNLGYKDDLCIKAYQALKSYKPSSLMSGVDINVDKKIPVGGGLGGGSADAAAVLRLLNQMFNLGCSPEELAQVAAFVGSDVPALVLAQHYRSAVLMRGRGELVECISRPSELPNKDVYLVNPRVHSSTKLVFQNYKNKPSFGPNKLENAAIDLYPKIGEALEFLKGAGAEMARMSGSGATVFGFANNLSIPNGVEYDIIRTKLLCDCPVV